MHCRNARVGSMTNPFDTDEFKKLKKEWYTKMKNETDFVDLENGEEVISQQVFTPGSTRHKGEAYYTLAEQIAQNFGFQRETDRVIFSLHADGCSLREIESKLKDNPALLPLKKSGIKKVIDRTLLSYTKNLK